MVTGLPITPPVPIPAPPACVQGCTLICLPAVVVGGPIVKVNIPRTVQPGGKVCIQTVCLTSRNCLNVSRGVEFTVQ